MVTYLHLNIITFKKFTQEQIGEHTEIRYRSHEKSSLFTRAARDFCYVHDSFVDPVNGNILSKLINKV